MMDKPPVTPSPYRFLLKSENTPHPPPVARRQPRSKQSGHELSALDKLDAPKMSAAFKLASTANADIGVQSRTQYQTRDLAPHADSASHAATEDSKLCTHNGVSTSNAGTAGGAGLVQVQKVQKDATGAEIRLGVNAPTQGQIAKESALSSQREPTNGMSRAPVEQRRTPLMSQFKAAPKFRFGSSENRSQSGSSIEGERTNTEVRSNVTPRPTQGRWRATQTPLRQSLRREPTEEEIVDGGEEMLMEDIRPSIEREDFEEEYENGQKSYIELHFASPAAKRRKISADPVQTSFSETQQHEEIFFQHHHDLHDGAQRDQAGKILEGEYTHDNDDAEMLYNDDHEEQLLLDGEIPTTSQHISSNPQSVTPAPTYSQRPRFILPSSTRRSLAPPATPQQHPPLETFAPTPHFIIHTPVPAHTPADDEPQFIRPPKFRPIEEPEPSEPLPAEFSPRRRGQKFVIGGLANEVRSWLVDLETQSSVSHTRQQKDDEAWTVKMLVEEANEGRGVGWTAARAKMQDGEGLSMILGGEGMMEGLEKGKEVVEGCVVGIKAPVWEVEVEGVRWGVGANWKTWGRGS